MQNPELPPAAPVQATDPGEGVDVKRAFTFVFKAEEGYRTLLMCALYMFVPVVGGLAFQGYMVRLTKNLVVRGDDRAMPPMDGFGDLINLGIPPFVVSMIAMFPLMFIMYFGMGLAVVVAMVLAGVASGGLMAAGLDPAISSMVGLVVAILAGVTTFVLVYVAMILVAYPLQAAMTLVDVSGKINYAWNFAAIKDFMRVLKPDYRRSFIKMMLANILVLTIGLLLCGIGYMPGLVVMTFASAHLRAQLYRLYLARGGEAVPMDPRM